MCRIFSWRSVGGTCTVLLLFPTRCAATPFGGSPPYYSHPEILILKVFWWRREWHITSVARPTTADLLLVVLPTTFWTLDLWVQNPLLGGFLLLRPHCHYVVRAILYAPVPLPVYYIWPFLTMDQLPHDFVSSRTPLVLEFPCGLELEPVISKTGYSHPVDRFRLSLPGSFNPGCIILVASDWLHNFGCFWLVTFWLSIGQTCDELYI